MAQHLPGPAWVGHAADDLFEADLQRYGNTVFQIPLAFATGLQIHRHHQRAIASGPCSFHQLLVERTVFQHIELKPEFALHRIGHGFHCRVRHGGQGVGKSVRGRSTRNRNVCIRPGQHARTHGRDDDGCLGFFAQQRRASVRRADIIQYARRDFDALEGCAVVAQSDFVFRAAVNKFKHGLRQTFFCQQAQVCNAERLRESGICVFHRTGLC